MQASTPFIFIFLFVLALSGQATVADEGKNQVLEASDIRVVEQSYGEHQWKLSISDAVRPKNSHRMPASTADVWNPENSLAVKDDKNVFSNREVYFRALYTQAYLIGNLLGGAHLTKDIVSCPSMHSAWLETSGLQQLAPMKNHLNEATLFKVLTHFEKGQDLKLAHPIFNIAGHSDQALDEFLKENRFKEIVSDVKEGLYLVGKGLVKEIAKMCEHGSSENYYTFENIVTYYSRDHAFLNSKDAFAKLARMPVVAHYVVLSDPLVTAGSSGLSSFDLNHQILFEKTGLSWLPSYLAKRYPATSGHSLSMDSSN